MKRLGIGVGVRVVYCKSHPEVIGQEGVIIRVGNSWDWIVRLEVTRPALNGLAPLPDFEWGFKSAWLIPIEDDTDTSEWANKAVKRVTKPVHVEPTVERVTK